MFVPLKAAENRDARQGLVDLAGWDRQTSLSMHGEWMFFANELVDPQDFLRRSADPQFSARFASVGLSFPEASQGTVPQQGYGTYVMRIRNWPLRTSLGFTGVQVYTAGHIYFFGADGQGSEAPIQTLGHVARTEDAGKPEIRDEEIQPLLADKVQDYYFLIQVSNHHHAWGGLWKGPVLGSIQGLGREERIQERLRFFVAGCLIFACVYNFSLFSRRPEDKGSLILGVMSFVLMLKSSTVSFFPAPIFGSYELAYQLNLRLLYCTMLIVPMLGAMFVRCYFPNHFPRRVARALVFCLALSAAFLSLLPILFFTLLDTMVQITGLASGAVVFGFVLHAWRNHERGAGLMAIGSFAVILGGLADVIIARSTVQTPFHTISLGLLVFIMCQSQIVAVHFAYAFRKAENFSRELQSEVARQTRDIQSVLDTIQQGIFTLVADGWTVGSQFSRHLKAIVQKEKIEGLRLNDFLLKNSDLSSDAQSQVMSVVHAAIGEDAIAFEVNAHCLPAEIQWRPDDGESLRTLELEWTPMVNSENSVDKILVCMRDVTEMRVLQQKAQRHEEELAILQEILRVSEDSFQRFIQKTESLLQQNRQLILNVDRYGKDEVVRRLFMNMHTIKGTARTYFLNAISATSHDVEQYYAALQKGQEAWDQERLLNDLERVTAWVRRYDQVGREKLGWSSSEQVLRLPRQQLIRSIDRLGALHDETLTQKGVDALVDVESILMKSCYDPLPSIVEDVCKGLEFLARDLGKPVPLVKIPEGSIIMRDEGCDLMHNILIHLFRNSLDHGLESELERKTGGKAAEGTIQIETQEHGTELVLFFGDDGQGLDLQKIERTAYEKGLLQSGSSLRPEQIADLIFQPGFSTKDEVTEMSGRGVGMDAVRNYLKDVGGAIAIQFLPSNKTQKGRSFRFEIRLPEKLWWSPTRRKDWNDHELKPHG